MNLGLVGIVWTVCQSSDSIAAGSAQIALGNAALGQHTDEQANPLEQTAASMEQLGATVRHNADDVHQANQFSLGASSAP